MPRLLARLIRWVANMLKSQRNFGPYIVNLLYIRVGVIYSFLLLEDIDRIRIPQ